MLFGVFSEDVMAMRALVGNHCLNCRRDARAIASRAGTHKGNKQVATSHSEVNLRAQKRSRSSCITH